MRALITTCAKYAHIMPTFARAFQRVWPVCPWPVTVLHAGQSEAESIPNLPADWQQHFTNADGWAASLLEYLGDSDEPFLLLLDDYILDALDHRLISAAARWFEVAPDIGMVRVYPCPGPTWPLSWWGYTESDFGSIDKREPYAISLQAAMWRPQVCRDLFRASENPWQTEISGSVRAQTYRTYKFIGTKQSAIGYRELMKRGAEIPDTRAWIEANLK